MRDHTAFAKAFVAASCALAVALLTIGMGVASAWADSDQPVVLRSTQVSLFELPGALA
jgi:hypothetical protein